MSVWRLRNVRVEIVTREGRYWALVGDEPKQWQFDLHNAVLAIQDRERELLREETAVMERELTKEVERRQAAEQRIGELQQNLERTQAVLRKMIEEAHGARQQPTEDRKGGG